ncbi:MAG: hypothetical protein KJ072_27780 [Verrucomicrobia bacterium]|nr:hypothetical protein [Verrucomicrobiota bacterium]
MRVIPSWVPRIDRIEKSGEGSIRLWVEAAGAEESELLVEGAETLSAPIRWNTLDALTVAGEESGWFKVEVPTASAPRYFRARIP